MQKKRKVNAAEQEAWQTDRRGKRKQVSQHGIAAASFSISAEAEDEKAQVYVVQSGDNLSKIAKAWLGDAARWKDILEANQDTLKNPRLIQVRQQLIIPPK